MRRVAEKGAEVEVVIGTMSAADGAEVVVIGERLLKSQSLKQTLLLL